MRLHSSAKVLADDVSDNKQVSAESVEEPTLSEQKDLEEKIQTSKNSSVSAFSLPTMAPNDALPESFRASQIEFPNPTTPRKSFQSYSGQPKHHKLHVQATRNNCIITLTTHDGSVMKRESGGSIGFKKAARSGYESAYQVAMSIFQQIEANRIKWRLANIDLIWKGLGQGREAVYRALLSSEGTQIRNLIRKMSDNTPLKIGGTRPKKRRSEYSACVGTFRGKRILTSFSTFSILFSAVKLLFRTRLYSYHSILQNDRIEWIPQLVSINER